MKHSFAGLRIGALLLLVFGFLSPMAATTAGAQGNDDYLADAQALADSWADAFDTWIEIDYFTNQATVSDDELQAANDAITQWSGAPDAAAALEAPDGAEDVQDALEDLADGYAEIATLSLQWNNFESGSDEEAELVAQIHEAEAAIADLQAAYDDAVAGAGDAADATDDESAGTSDADTYLADVEAQIAAWADLLFDLDDLDPLRTDVTDAEVEQINAILTEMAQAPDVAAGFTAPEGLEDIQSDFEDLAAAYAELSDIVVAWSETEVGSDEEAEAEATYDELQNTTIPNLHNVTVEAVDDAQAELAGGDTADDSADDGAADDTDTGDADTYLADAQALADSWADAFDTWIEIDYFTNQATVDDDQLQAVNDAVTLWSGAPDAAAALEAPDGAEDVQDALEDLADGYAEIATLSLQWNNFESGSDEEAELVAQIHDAEAAIADLQAAYDDAVAAASGAGDATDDSSDDGAADGADSGDADAYVTDAQALVDSWAMGIERWNQLDFIENYADFAESETQEAMAIVALWAGAPDAVAALTMPDGYEDAQAALEDLAQGYADIASDVNAWVQSDIDSDEEAAIEAEIADGIDALADLGDAWDTALAEAGA